MRRRRRRRNISFLELLTFIITEIFNVFFIFKCDLIILTLPGGMPPRMETRTDAWRRWPSSSWRSSAPSWSFNFINFFTWYSFPSPLRCWYSHKEKNNKKKKHCIVLFWWSGDCCPMLCDLFKIYCAPPNLGITRTWICRLNFAQRPIFFRLDVL